MISDDVRRLVEAVIYDGRYVRSISTDPAEVARRLGIPLGPEDSQALQQGCWQQIVAEVLDRMTHDVALRVLREEFRAGPLSKAICPSG